MLPSDSDPSGVPSSGTPRSLLQRVRAGEPAAWEALVALYAPLVYHWCRRRDLQEQDARDVHLELQVGGGADGAGATGHHARLGGRELRAEGSRGNGRDQQDFGSFHLNDSLRDLMPLVRQSP